MIYILDCSSVELASIITILKNILNIVWIITPILAIVYLSVAIIKMAKDPEDKKLPKNVKNIVLALIIVFMVPTIVNAFMYITDNKTDISSCWKNTISFAPTSEYQEPISNLPKNQIINNSKDYEKGDKRKEENDSNNKNNSNGTTPAATASVQNLLKAAKKAANHTYSRGYRYWDAHSWDGTDMWDDYGKRAVSCDRGVALTLYFAGLTTTEPYKLSLYPLSEELANKGWKKITNYDDLMPGDIVFYNSGSGTTSLGHTFIIGETIDVRYDWGMDDRIQFKGNYSGGAPFREGISKERFLYAYRLP